MISKTRTTTLIIAMISLVGLAVPAGVSQTVSAQSIADDAVGGTLLEGFFDGESNEEEEADDTESQETDQQQDQDREPGLPGQQRDPVYVRGRSVDLAQRNFRRAV